MKISYISPLFNDELWVIEFLDSMIPIVVKGDEHLIIDDKSTDSTIKEIEGWANRHPNYPLRLIKNEVNLGMPKNCNKCIQEAKNEVIAYTDADYYLPTRGHVIRGNLNKENALIHTSYYKRITDEDKKIPIEGFKSNLVEATANFDHRGKAKIQMSTVAEWRENALKYLFRETYTWHNLYFERFLRLNKSNVWMRPVNVPTTVWTRRVGNYDRHKAEVEVIQRNIYNEYGVKY